MPKTYICGGINPRDGKFYADAEHTTEEARIVQVSDGKINVSAPDSGAEHDWVLIVMKEKTEVPVEERTYFNMEEATAVKKVFEW